MGAEFQPGHGVDFRLWAPVSSTVTVEFVDPMGTVVREVALEAQPGGYFAGFVGGAAAGARYRFRLEKGAWPDPASRYQPEGPMGLSEIVDATFSWTDHAWKGRPDHELVLYELHLGTFTREGTWRAAMAELPELARLGVTMIEVMPVAEFPGRFGWGYDGVSLFAPSRLYGTPQDMRAFVNRAHELGVAVILDVVYNHLGPDGNALPAFSPHWFSRKYRNEWGEPLNFDGPESAAVREFFVSNARYWIEEFHLDGLRLDATQQIFDASETHVLAEIGAAAREAAGDRRIYLIGENETQEGRCVRPREAGGYGLDALWNDDFHHAAIVAATGRREAYYCDYRGRAQEFVSAAKHGFLYQGQWYRWQEKRRGQPAFDLRPANFVQFLENHDQVANSARGERLHRLTSPAQWRTLTALLLLTPQIPLLFQGQEFAASAPFLYFADHKAELHAQVAAGRKKFLQQFPSLATADGTALLADPGDPAVVARCRLDFAERERHASAYQLHEDLLRLRRDEPVLTRPARLDGAVLGESAFVLRYFTAAGDGDRLLVVNLGGALDFLPSPEPLLAPVAERGWAVQWSSEAPRYGGHGTPPWETTAGWLLPGQSAVLLRPDENRPPASCRLSEKH